MLDKIKASVLSVTGFSEIVNVLSYNYNMLQFS